MSYSNRHLKFPFQIGKSGRSIQVDSLAEHIKEELMQLILTDKGERWYLTDLGGGARKMLFKNFDTNRTAVAKVHLTQEINKWLGHRITLIGLDFNQSAGILTLVISYSINDTELADQVKLEIDTT